MDKQHQIKGILSFAFLIFIMVVLSGKMAAQQSAAKRLAELKNLNLSTSSKVFYKGNIQTKINVNFEGISLPQALKKIAQKGHLKLTYRGDIIPYKKVTVHSKNISVSDVLNQVLKGLTLTYKVSKDRYLVVIPKEKLHLKRVSATVSGTVTNARTGNPMVGVNILVVGTSTGTVTNVNGHYSLNVPSLQDSLRFSFVGFENEIVPIKGRTNIDVALNRSIKGLKSLIVTARSRAEVSSHVPITEAHLSSKQIINAGVKTTKTYMQLIPNVKFTASDNIGTNFITIRGISQNRNTATPVAISVDGVLQNSPKEFAQQMYDLKSIEVLKGPQGPLYGRNALGGAILIKTNDPTNYWDGYTLFGIGNGGQRETEGAIGGPIVKDKLQFRLAGRYMQKDGLMPNVTLNKKADHAKYILGRGKLRWFITPHFQADILASFGSADVGTELYNYQPTIFAKDGLTLSHMKNPFDFSKIDVNKVSHRFEANNIGDATRHLRNYALKLEYGLPFATIHSITSHMYLKLSDRADNFPYTKSLTRTIKGLGTYDATQTQYFDIKTWSQKIKLISSGNDHFRWQLGARFLSKQKYLSSSTGKDTGQGVLRVKRHPFPAGTKNPTLTFLGNENKSRAFAVFGHIAYKTLNDNLELSAGLRYDYDRVKEFVSKFNTSGQPGSSREKVFDKIQPKFTIRYIPDIKSNSINFLNVYSSWGIGYRNGIFNQNGVAQLAKKAGLNGVKNIVDEEVAKSFEFGFKSKWFDNRFSLKGAYFYTWDTNAPFFQFIGAVGAQIIVTVDKSIMQGFGLQARAKLSKNLSFYISPGYTYTEIKDYTINPAYVGNHLPYVPITSLSSGLQYHHKVYRGIGILVRIDYTRTGKQPFAPSNEQIRLPLNLFNLRVGFQSISNTWSLMLQGYNITNKYYNTDFVTGGFATPAEPSQWKVNLRINF